MATPDGKRAGGKEREFTPDEQRGVIGRMIGAVKGAAAGAAKGAAEGAKEAFFGPAKPQAPVAEQEAKGRQFDYPYAVNLLATKPRSEQGENQIDFTTLRRLADPAQGGFDLLRLAIETRKDQMGAQAWKIVPRDKTLGDGGERAKALEKALRRPDGVNTFRSWQRMLLEDNLVVDAAAIYLRRTKLHPALPAPEFPAPPPGAQQPLPPANGAAAAGAGDQQRPPGAAGEPPPGAAEDGEPEPEERVPGEIEEPGEEQEEADAGDEAAAERTAFLDEEVPREEPDEAPPPPPKRKRAAARPTFARAFDPDQPRDEAGRWTSSGPGSATATHATKHGDVTLTYSEVGSDVITPTVEARDADGNLVGVAEFVTEGMKTGSIRAGRVRVAEKYRRQGLATAMYGIAAHGSGSTIEPSDFQTADGEKFVAAYKGKAEWAGSATTAGGGEEPAADAPHADPPAAVLKKKRPALASAAQRVYDEWDENEDEYAGGGICHLIADEIAVELGQAGIEASTVSAEIGEQHVWVIARTSDGIYTVDIDPYRYESGGGYTWRKKQGVKFDASDIEISRVDDDPSKWDDYVERASQAAAEHEERIQKGDYDGHPFRGNQHTDGPAAAFRSREAKAILREDVGRGASWEQGGCWLAAAAIAEAHGGKVVMISSHAPGDRDTRENRIVQHVAVLRDGRLYDARGGMSKEEMLAGWEDGSDPRIEPLNARRAEEGLIPAPSRKAVEALARLLSNATAKVAKGDRPGHPFRGNQHTDGEGGGAEEGAGSKPAKRTPEFKEWFGASKVVNRDGSPALVYHGTTQGDWMEFDAGEVGFHFGTRDAASMLDAGRLIEAHLSIQNPVRLPDLGTWDPDEVRAALWSQGVLDDDESSEISAEIEWLREQHRAAIEEESAGYNEAAGHARMKAIYALSEPIRRALKAKGYDGIVYANEAEGRGDSWIAFDSSQIKLASNRKPTRAPQINKAALAKGDLPGHPFRGNQYVDGAGSGEDGSARVFHGTAESYVESILREGISIAGAQARRNHDGIFYEGGRGESVFVTDSEKSAMTWGDTAALQAGRAANKHTRAVALEIRIPASERARLLRDTIAPGGEDWSFTGTIKPEWIVGAKVMSDEEWGAWEPLPIARRARKAEEGYATLHAVVLIARSEIAKGDLPGHPFRGNQHTDGVTSTPAFRAWFGRSKVVNEDGTPRVVHHGTAAPDDIESFTGDRAGEGSGNVGIWGRGVAYFGDPDVASDYAEGRAGNAQRDASGKKGSARVVPVYLSLQRPFVWSETRPLEEFREFARSLPGVTPEDVERINATSLRLSPTFTVRVSSAPSVIESLGVDRWTKLLKDAGYDGVIVNPEKHGQYPNSAEYVAFRPEQIKSAIGNSGAFDPKDPRIHRAIGAGEEPPKPTATKDWAPYFAAHRARRAAIVAGGERAIALPDRRAGRHVIERVAAGGFWRVAREDEAGKRIGAVEVEDFAGAVKTAQERGANIWAAPEQIAQEDE